jgi:uncharacterized protein YmfQ (DUF2313 family)
MTKETIFDPGTQEDHVFMLAKHMPVGRAWSNAFNADSNIGKLIKGLAIEYYRLSVMTQKISTEMDINQTTDLITEWEESVGIPDDCFSNEENLERRRLQAREKLANFGGVQKVEDFERVAAVFGFTVDVRPASSTQIFPYTFPLTLYDSSRDLRHTIEVEIIGGVAGEIFPLTFPFTFTEGGESFLRCIFEALAPANVNVIFV